MAVVAVVPVVVEVVPMVLLAMMVVVVAARGADCEMEGEGARSWPVFPTIQSVSLRVRTGGTRAHSHSFSGPRTDYTRECEKRRDHRGL